MRRPGLFVVFIVLLFSCTIKDKKPAPVAPSANNAYSNFYRQIEEGKTSLQDGDLVVRSGNDITSQLIKNFNRKDKNYSHSGIVFFNDGVPFVYHILAGFENPDAKMVTDSLQIFCHPRHNHGFAIYRYAMDSSEIVKMKQLVSNWHRQGVRFDSTFNLRSDDRMYCSEMIQKALARATKNRIVVETVKPTKAEAHLASTKIPLTAAQVQKLDIIPIDNLYINQHCRLVQRFDFNTGQ